MTIERDGGQSTDYFADAKSHLFLLMGWMGGGKGKGRGRCRMKSGRVGERMGRNHWRECGCHAKARGSGEWRYSDDRGIKEGWRVAMMDAPLSFHAP